MTKALSRLAAAAKRLALVLGFAVAAFAVAGLADGFDPQRDAEAHGLSPEDAVQMHRVIGARSPAELFPPHR